MTKKAFGLEQVLTYRKEVEKACKMEFNVARQEFDCACERLNDEVDRVDRLSQELQDRQQEGMTAMELQLYADFFRRKIVDISTYRKETVTLGDRMAEKQDQLFEAAVDKKMLETLKEKKMQAHKREMLEKERNFLEEIALRKKGHGK